MANFEGQRVLVTGGSRGIGHAVAQAFHKAGARVAINGRTPATVAAAIDRIGGGDRLYSVPGNVATVEGCEAIVGAAVQELGGLDVLVNSAGVAYGRRIEDSDEAIWNETININLRGTFFCCRSALPALRAAEGNIVNVASDAGLMGNPMLAVYCASKGGVVLLTKSMALELAPTVRVNCVCPGYVDTDMVRRDLIDRAKDPIAKERAVIEYSPMKRMGLPTEVASAVLYLASPTAGFVTGATLQIDGGATAGH